VTAVPAFARDRAQAHRNGGWELAFLSRRSVVGVVLRRVALAVPLLVAVSGLSFVLVSVTPGDAARQIVGVNASQATYLSVRKELGLNLPVYTQYWHWLTHAIHGDLGTSLLTGQAVGQTISSRLPVTIALVGVALLVSLVVGVALGVASAVRGGVLGRAIDAFALLGFAFPVFWVGAILIAVFAVKLRWFPASGYVPISESVGQWLSSFALPALALSLGGIAAMAKQTRESMLDVLGSEYIRMVRASGLAPSSIVLRHALKNAAAPVLTVLGVQAVGLLGGTILVENVFALPGLGSLVVSATLGHDLPVVEGVAVVFTLIVVAVNLAIDIGYTLLNPRIDTR